MNNRVNSFRGPKMARKKFSAEFKAKVALEFISDELTIAQLSSKYGVHPTQIKEWKSTLIAGAKELFTRKKEEGETSKEYVDALERKTGQLAVEVDFLKKNLTSYQKKNG
jgi:transposase-like protein